MFNRSFFLPLLMILFLLFLTAGAASAQTPVIPPANTPAADEALVEEVTVTDEIAVEEPAPSPTEEVPPGLAILLTLAATVTGFMEYAKSIFIKPISDKQKWSDEKYVTVVSAVAIFVGIAAALIAGPDADVLRMVGITTLPSVVGVSIAGILVAFGNSVVHQFYDAARSLSSAMRAWESRQWDKVSGGAIIAISSAPTATKLEGGGTFKPDPQPAN